MYTTVHFSVTLGASGFLAEGIFAHALVSHQLPAPTTRDKLVKLVAHHCQLKCCYEGNNF